MQVFHGDTPYMGGNALGKWDAELGWLVRQKARLGMSLNGSPRRALNNSCARGWRSVSTVPFGTESESKKSDTATHNV